MFLAQLTDRTIARLGAGRLQRIPVIVGHSLHVQNTSCIQKDRASE
jgi:hypothetical protein